MTCGPMIVRKGEDVYTKFWTGGSGRPVRRTWRRAHRRSRVGQPSLGGQRQHGGARLLVGGEGGRPLWGEGGREGGTADRRWGGGARRRAPGHRRGGRSAAPPRSTWARHGGARGRELISCPSKYWKELNCQVSFVINISWCLCECQADSKLRNCCVAHVVVVMLSCI